MDTDEHRFENQIIQGDCLDIMREIPDNSIDCIITDPPYGISYKSNRTNNHDYIENDEFDDWNELVKNVLPEMSRVITDNGCCCCCCGGGGKTPVTAHFTIEFIKHLHLIQTLIWDKLTIGLGWKYRPSYETILVGSKSKDDYAFYDNTARCSNIIRCNNVIPLKGMHPTQKPVKLIEKLILIHTKPGDLILDPFLGSGTTAVAALRTGRRFIGIELSEEYCNIARKRVAEELAQPRLFEFVSTGKLNAQFAGDGFGKMKWEHHELWKN